MNEPVVLSIVESSQIGEARRLAQALAAHLGFNEIDRGKVGIVATEIASNLVRHVSNGVLLIQTVHCSDQVGIEFLALDKGPGMGNISECLRDGFSTSGTAGKGLGAIFRLSSQFDIHSTRELGTALLAQLWATPDFSSPATTLLELGAVCLPKMGEVVSGDAWTRQDCGDRILLLVTDGLGHGPLAAEASSEAVQILHAQLQHSPQEIITAMHAGLRKTRGAAVAVAELNLSQQQLSFAGVGNIAGAILSPTGTTRLVSHNGTVGHEVRKIQEFTHPWQPNSLLILHSDGLSSQWNLSHYPGLITKHPSLIAGILYRDFKRDRDDVTVVVVRG
jgi:anti-sigma regulatory factor (Ser/Thr protein kinase)